MSENKNIASYNAADIEKYWKGKLSAAEMHSMEKAAMDDPFLADALEGYQHTATGTADLDFLKEQLTEKTGGPAKVVSIGNKNSWWKIAAAVIGLAGIALLTTKFVTNNKEGTVAVAEQKETTQPAIEKTTNELTTDTISAVGNTEKNEVVVNRKNVQPQGDFKALKADSASNNYDIPDNAVAQIESKDAKAKAATADVAETITQSAPSAPALSEDEKKNEDDLFANRAKVNKDKELKLDEASKNNTAGLYKPETNKKGKAITFNFSARITDQYENPIPNANVVNLLTQDKVSSNALGYFTIPASKDTLLLLDVQSNGFNSREFRLNRLNKKNNDLILYEPTADEAPAIVQLAEAEYYDALQTFGRNAGNSPQPEPGWLAYNQYLAINIKTDRSDLSAGEVILNFTISGSGRPVGITVTKKLSVESDNEAIRLINAGPKWIANGKPGNISIIVRFR